MAKGKGFIYILRNAAMPGLLKIGYSVKVPTERANELYTTGVPESFELAYYCLVENAEKLETQIHRNFSEYRHRSGREFFSIELEAVVQAVANLCKPKHEWRAELFQSVGNNDAQTAYEIVILSRYGIEREIKEMDNFSEAADQRSLAPYVRSLFYDSNSCCCNFELADEVEPYGHIANELLEIALETISQFEWFGQIQHGKPLHEL